MEACVLIVERWLIGRLRNRVFTSLADLNAATGQLLLRLNEERPIRRLGRTRRQLLEEFDRPALKPLPIEPYVFAEWRLRRVGIDYHVDVDNHFYSVPHSFARAQVEVRLTTRTDKEACLDDEHTAESTLAQNWSKYNATDKTQCIGNVKTGGPASYVELLSCLEIMRDAKEIREGDPLIRANQPV